MTEERPKFKRCISTLAIDHVDTPRSPQQSQNQELQIPNPDIPLEADFEVCVVDLTNEAIANVEKSLLKMTNVVHDISTGIPIKLSVDKYDCLKQTLDRKLHILYGVARTAAKRVAKDH